MISRLPYYKDIYGCHYLLPYYNRFKKIMCVDTRRQKWCHCFSLTTATLILGAMALVECIFDAVAGLWVCFGSSLVISVLFFMVLVNP